MQLRNRMTGTPSGGEAPSSQRSRKPLPVASLSQHALAWSVHLYTGMGLLINMYAIHAALYAQSGPNFTLFARLNWLAIFVDATDGTLARRFDVKSRAQGLDGALLDNIIDFQTFALLPALAVCIFEEVPGKILQYSIAGAVLMASGYQFCQTTAKTSEAFVGFPSYWNIVLFYVHYLRPSTIITCVLFFGCAVLSFVPIHFVYPTRTKAFFAVNIMGAYLWGLLMVVPTMFPKWKYGKLCMQLSLIYVVYYFGVSLYLDNRRRKAEKGSTAA